jgi:hypothetical protein
VDALATALLAAKTVDDNATEILTDAKTADAKAVTGLAADKENAVAAFKPRQSTTK